MAESALPKKKRGRPRNEERLDMAQEYTSGQSGSFYSGVSSFADLQRLHGSVDDIDITLGWEAKDRMDNDPNIAAALSTRALGATSRSIEVVPAPAALFRSDSDERKADEVAAFIRRCVVYLGQSHRDLNLTAYQLLRSALKVGHSKAEICTDLAHGGIDNLKRVPIKVKSKDRNNSCFVVDRQNNIVGIAGYTGTYGKDYGSPYALPSVKMHGTMPFGALSDGWKLIDRSKWLIVTNQAPDSDSPLGQSLLRAVYTAYRNKRDAWVMWLKSLDNTAQGMDVFELPEHSYNTDTYPLVNGVPDTSGEKVPMATAVMDGLKYARQAGIFVHPHTGRHSRVHSSASGDPFLSMFNFCDSQIAIGILMQTLATGTDRHMARAAGQVHQDVLDLAHRHDRALIENSITRDLFAPLIKANFPKDYWHLTPSASFGKVELQDFAAWATALSKLAQSGLILPSQFAYIWSILGLPQGDLKELQEQVARDKAVIEEIMEPEIDAMTGEKKPSQAARYMPQEVGKRMTRNAGAQIASRAGSEL
jgi:phage gp29-like protein